MFSVPTATFVKYNTTKTLPYWFKRYVKFDKSASLEPLYQLDRGEEFLDNHGHVQDVKV